MGGAFRPVLTTVKNETQGNRAGMDRGIARRGDYRSSLSVLGFSANGLFTASDVLAGLRVTPSRPGRPRARSLAHEAIAFVGRRAFRRPNGFLTVVKQPEGRWCKL
jgi:hypothetical protein